MYNLSLIHLLAKKQKYWDDDPDNAFIFFIITYVILVITACFLAISLKDNFKKQPVEFQVMGYDLGINNGTCGNLIAESESHSHDRCEPHDYNR